MSDPATVVLVHGSWHGPWAWEKVAPLLERRGIRAVTPALPSVGADPSRRGDMHADAAVVRRALEETGTPAVLVGHSYAGVVITEASAGRSSRVKRLVYLCSFMPDADECLFDQLSLVDEVLLAPGAGVDIDDDGTLRFDPAYGPSHLYNDCSAEDAERALARIAPQNGLVGQQKPTGVGWREIPSTYVVCSDDRTISPKLQRLLAGRATETVEWTTSHSPMLSQPQLVADFLAALATA